MTSDGALVFRAGGKFRVSNQLPIYCFISPKPRAERALEPFTSASRP